jgi:hypothetical protein
MLRQDGGGSAMASEAPGEAGSARAGRIGIYDICRNPFRARIVIQKLNVEMIFSEKPNGP